MRSTDNLNLKALYHCVQAAHFKCQENNGRCLPAHVHGLNSPALLNLRTGCAAGCELEPRTPVIQTLYLRHRLHPPTATPTTARLKGDMGLSAQGASDSAKKAVQRPIHQARLLQSFYQHPMQAVQLHRLAGWTQPTTAAWQEKLRSALLEMAAGLPC